MKNKTVTLEISKYNNPEMYEHGETSHVATIVLNTDQPAGEVKGNGYLAKIVAFVETVTGWSMEADDVIHFDEVWRVGETGFKYGPNWEFYIHVNVVKHD